ncbi:MAG: hypothetical protein ABFD16_00875 [Thermoguttaceae bacterium]|jgi:hypothetical protein
MPSNPYESPQHESSNAAPQQRVSRRAVFWGGVAAVFLAPVMLNTSQFLHVQSRSAGGHHHWLVAILDIGALVAVVGGCVALVARHWIPEPRRRFPGQPRRG